MELDDFKQRWEEQDRKLDTSLRLNTRLLRESVLGKTETALRRLSRLLWFEILVNLLAVLWIGSFLADHISEPRFAIPAATLHLGAILLIAAGARQLVALKALDYGAPVVAIQKRLESLRAERIRAVKWTLIAAPLAWTPLMIVGLKALFGVDAWSALGVPYVAANLVLGVVVITLAVWLSRRYENRMRRLPAAQRLMRTLAGTSLASATVFLDTISRFEEEGSTAS